MKNLHLVPAVVGWRLTSLWLGAVQPTALRRRERDRMATEKAAAAWTGILSAQMALATAPWAFWLDLAGGVSPNRAASRALTAVPAASMRSAERTLSANARRLARRKTI